MPWLNKLQYAPLSTKPSLRDLLMKWWPWLVLWSVILAIIVAVLGYFMYRLSETMASFPVPDPRPRLLRKSSV
jgi:H+/Cl- antiporter ClcA